MYNAFRPSTIENPAATGATGVTGAVVISRTTGAWWNGCISITAGRRRGEMQSWVILDEPDGWAPHEV